MTDLVYLIDVDEIRSFLLGQCRSAHILLIGRSTLVREHPMKLLHEM